METRAGPPVPYNRPSYSGETAEGPYFDTRHLSVCPAKEGATDKRFDITESDNVTISE
jgi:hypothetical protein